MAAALLRGGAGLCVRCIQRELCRLVWRPQTASFSSKQSDKKQPRRTHIKKAKPPPAVDVAKLLEQLYSQRRPGTAPPAARPAQASTRPTGPPATSSKSASRSNVPPVSPAASSVKPADHVSALPHLNSVPEPKPKPSVSYETTPGLTPASTAAALSDVTVPTTKTPAPHCHQTPAVETQTPAETKEEAAPELFDHTAASVPPTSEGNGTTSAPPAATVQALVEPSVESESVMTKPALETGESEAAVVPVSAEPSVKPTVDTSTVEASTSPVETLQTGAAIAEGSGEPPTEAAAVTEAEVVSASGTESGADGLSLVNKVEATVESTSLSSESGTVDRGVSVSEVMTLESVTLAEAEALVESLQSDHLLQTSALSHEAEKILQESEEQVRRGSEHRAAAEPDNINEAEADSFTEVLSQKESLSEEVEVLEAETDILMEELLCSAPDLHPRAEEAMTPESVTEVTAGVRTLGTEALRATRTALEEETETNETLEEQKEMEDGRVHEETRQPEILTLDSLMEASDTLEAERSIMLEAVVCADPQPKVPDPLPVGPESGPQQEAEGQETDVDFRGQEGSIIGTLTPESITLAEVNAGFGAFETEVLQEIKTALEEEVEKAAKEERMNVRLVIEEGTVTEETREDEIITLDSLTEAADALEAETSVVLEAMFCSEAQLRPPQDPHLDGPKLGPQEEGIGEEGDEASRGLEGGVLEAMTHESVTLAEVEVSLGGLESLSETSAHLEEEADALAQEEKMEMDGGAALEEMNEALTVESVSLSETSCLPETPQTEAQMEELLFFIPAHRAVGSEALVDQEVVKDDMQDEEVVRETPLSDKEEMFQTKAGEEEELLHEALTPEALMISEVKPLMETGELDAEEGEEEKQMMEQIVFGEAAEPSVSTEEEILTKAEVLFEAVDALEEESVQVTCPVSGVATATITTGPAAADAAGTETDTYPGCSSTEDIERGQEEGGPQTGAPGGSESTQTGLDPVQRLFLEKIREYNQHRLHGGTLEEEPHYETLVSEETAKLQRLHGGGDLSSFPQFTFSEPELDQDSK
ncbi:uncharacterized protein LOC143015446 isoform X2 [Genypterus blacodes]|uniref:uncharacterized protein LOC143015446 isoform X2 n=1 Tax=Genypterus blacodes TaxID=154954 RepID=UPI003F768525